MSDLRKAAQQALEALEEACGNRCNAEYNPCYCRAAADALQTALAQPEQEPVAYQWVGTKWLGTSNYYPDCALRTEAAEEVNRRANAGWSLMSKKMVAAEQDRCCRIVFGLCVSDNNAQQIVDKIRSGK
jgi:hypothetical protein